MSEQPKACPFCGSKAEVYEECEMVKIRCSSYMCQASVNGWHDEVEDAIEAWNRRADRPQEWIPCSERLPETDNTNVINEFDVLLAVRPKKHPERTPQVYIGKLRPVEGDDGSGNFWGVKTASCEWTIWGWSYFQEPEVLAWMPLPKPWKGADDE